MPYRISQHAAAEMGRRGISEAEVSQAMANAPGAPSRDGLFVRQAIVGAYLIRVVVNPVTVPEVVVTAYRTSKLKKYGAKIGRAHV